MVLQLSRNSLLRKPDHVKLKPTGSCCLMIASYLNIVKKHSMHLHIIKFTLLLLPQYINANIL